MGSVTNLKEWSEKIGYVVLSPYTMHTLPFLSLQEVEDWMEFGTMDGACLVRTICRKIGGTENAYRMVAVDIIDWPVKEKTSA